ncbi:MAG TPA: DUF4129 domain-containing protein [Trebonia sp.]|jgi:hypothetical protein|nr:DUF4129 domain-containing protein [Trebonia sp.]
MTSRQQLARLLSLGLLILLGIAGLHGAFSAPRWDGPLKSAGLVIGIVLEVILATLLVITHRRHKAAASAAATAGTPDDPTRADVPARLRIVLMWLLPVAMIAVAVVLLVDAHLHMFSGGKALTQPSRLKFSKPKPAPSVKPSAGPAIPLGPILWGLLIAVLVAAILLTLLWASKQRRGARPEPFTDELAEDSAGLRDAVESGRAAFAILDDAREAIIACYSAMENTLAERGTARRAADTPDELLARAVSGGIVGGLAAGAAEELTTLFYEARFSSHPLGQEQRDAARQALDYLADELAKPSRDAAAAGASGAPGPAGAAGTAR